MPENKSVVVALSIIVTLIVTVGAVGSVSADEGPTLADLEGSGTNDDPYIITTAAELQLMENDLGAHYALGNNIDATETHRWNAGSGFNPIGSEEKPFTGVLDGKNHSVEAIKIRRLQLFNSAVFVHSKGTIKNIHFENIYISGTNPGGVVGVNEEDGVIQSVSATGEVTGEGQDTGGFVNKNYGRIERSWADVDISEADLVGGFVNGNHGGIENSYSLGNVSGEVAAGFIDRNSGGVLNVYATGEINGGTYDYPNKENSAGLAVYPGTLVDSYWNTETTGQDRGVAEYGKEGGTGLTTDEMTGPAAKENMDAFDFEDTWATTDSYPILQWQIESFDAYTERIIRVNDSTTIVTKLDLIGERTESANEVANFESSNASIATIEDRTVTAEREGSVKITATHADHTATTSVLVISNEGISAIDAETEDDEVEANETVTVTGTFRNVDANATHRNISLTVNGEAVVTQNVSVNASSDATHTFEWTPKSAGNYDLAIDGIDAGSIEVTPEPTPTPTDMPTEEPTSTESSEQTTERSDATTEASDGTTATDETVPTTEANQDDTGEETTQTDSDDESGLPTGPLVGGVAIVAVTAGVIVGRRV